MFRLGAPALTRCTNTDNHLSPTLEDVYSSLPSVTGLSPPIPANPDLPEATMIATGSLPHLP
ncbi:hypothetical protein BC628DRAFT_1366021 [Trametes gibbosa]|nr:hypothetical protein BC628DRAFT_1366021 [Trametes gibbosa]